MAQKAHIGLVGTGWRSEFYIRIALALPEEFEIVGIVARRAASAEIVKNRWALPVYSTLFELLSKTKPDFIISSVSWISNPEVLTECVKLSIPVLSETPPAPDIDALRKLWSEIGSKQLVQVAEQNLCLPSHVARKSVVDRGDIGTPTSVQISSTHGYHAISILREFLGFPMETVEVQAITFNAPLIDPLSRSGWNVDFNPKSARTTLATIDFGDGRSALYDFTDNQWHNQLRHRRILIRGSEGEIYDDSIIRFRKPSVITKSQFNRYQLGHDLNLDGHDVEHISLDGEVVYTNPFVGKRFMDEEIAMATLMRGMSLWVFDDGPEPYTLAQAAQDFLISLAIDESVLLGLKVRTNQEDWSD
jgi:predicted dehydrogenase